MGQNRGELEVGVEIVRVDGQFFAECGCRAVGITSEQQRLAVVGVE